MYKILFGLHIACQTTVIRICYQILKVLFLCMGNLFFPYTYRYIVPINNYDSNSAIFIGIFCHPSSMLHVESPQKVPMTLNLCFIVSWFSSFHLALGPSDFDLCKANVKNHNKNTAEYQQHLLIETFIV